MKRVLMVGTRYWRCWDSVRDAVRECVPEGATVKTGFGSGADSMVRGVCDRARVPWKAHGTPTLARVDFLVAFVLGEPGKRTKKLIDKAAEQGIPYRMYFAPGMYLERRETNERNTKD